MFDDLLDSKPTGVLISIFLVLSIVFTLRQVGLLQGLELAAYDLHMQYRTNQAINAEESPIILIRVYEKDIQQLRHYPLMDSVIAEALEQLVRWKAKVIGVDIFRDLPSQGRDRLQQVVLENPSIVMIETLTGNNPVLPPDFLTNQNQIGFVDLKQDHDSVIRRGLLMMWDDQHKIHFSFPLQLAFHYLKDYGLALTADPEDPGNIKLNNIVFKRVSANDGAYQLADDGGYQFMLNYPQVDVLQSYSFMDVLNKNQELQKRIENKIVILGVTTESVQDLHETPFSRVLESEKPMYGLTVHANATQQFINAALDNQKQVTISGDALLLTGLLIISLIGALIGMNYPRLIVFGLTAMAGTSLLFILCQVMFNRSVWLPLVPWLLGFLLSLLVTAAINLKRETTSRKLIMDMFGKFVTPEVAQHLWQQRSLFIQGGRPKQQELTVTVLFADMQGYTSSVEKMAPAEVLEWSNAYMGMMTVEASRFTGLVDDYAGDGIKVNFGVPVPRTKESERQQDARNAVEYALSIGKRLAQINQDMKSKGFPEASLRIGIATGTVSAGSQGSLEHMKYTTLGDAVNTAARLESFEKEMFKQEDSRFFRILISDTTEKYLSNNYWITSLGKHSLPGQKKYINIYSISGKVC